MNKKENSYFLIIYLFFVFGYVFSRGFYSMTGAILLFIIFSISLIYLYFNIMVLPIKYILSEFLMYRIVLLTTLILSIYLYGGFYQNKNIFYDSSFYILMIIIFFSIFISNIKKSYFFFILGFTILGIFLIISSPSPLVDVYIFLKEGANGILHGQNPYSMIFTRINNYQFYYKGISNFYSYLPGTILLSLPGVLMFNDPRISMLMAHIISGILIGKISKNNYLSLIFLFNPLIFLILEQSWTESLILLLLTSTLYFFYIKKILISCILFGILLATKQYGILIVPFYYLLLKKYNFKYLLISMVVAFLIITPFLFWNYKDFIYDAIFLQFNFPIRYDGLTFGSLLYNEFKIVLPAFIYPVLWIVFFIVIIIRIYRKMGDNKVIFGLFLFLFGFFYFNKWSFANYYYFLSSLIILAIVFFNKQRKYKNES